MQVDLSTVLSAAGAVIMALLAGYVALLRYTFDQRERHNDDKVSALRAKIEAENASRLAAEKSSVEDYKRFTERLHMDELATVKLQGDLAMLKQSQDTHVKSFDDLVQNVVTKREFEARMDGLEEALKRAVTTLERAAGAPTRYGPRYPTPSPATSDPPKRGGP